MTTLKQSVSVEGRVISNNDPEMVIKLDSHPAVQISSIQPDSITYGFTGLVTPDAIYNLNLTFTYKGIYTKVVALEFTHIASVLTAKEVGSTLLVTGENNTIYFDVKDQNDNPIVGLDLDGSLNAKTEPPYGTTGGNSGRLFSDGSVPGRYYFTAVVGPAEGVLNANIKVKKGDFKTTLNKLSWTFEQSPITKTVDPTSLVIGVDTTLEVSFEQKRNGSVVPIVGTIEVTSITGGEVVTPFTHNNDKPGTYVGVVKSTPPSPEATIVFKITEDWVGTGNNIFWENLTTNLANSQPPRGILVEQVDTELAPVISTHPVINLKYDDGEPVVGAKAVSTDLTATPKYGAWGNYSNALSPVEGVPGQYTLKLDTWHIAGTAAVDMIISVDGRETSIPTMNFSHPGTPMVAVPIAVFPDHDIRYWYEDYNDFIKVKFIQDRFQNPGYQVISEDVRVSEQIGIWAGKFMYTTGDHNVFMGDIELQQFVGVGDPASLVFEVRDEVQGVTQTYTSTRVEFIIKPHPEFIPNEGYQTEIVGNSEEPVTVNQSVNFTD